jgi:hypothetical protein
MFLCSKCHDPACTMHFSGSTGPCEGCGKTAQCVDCRNMAPPKKRKKVVKPPKPKPAPKVLSAAEEKAVRLFGVGAGVAYRVTSKTGYGRRKFVPMERIWATLDAARAVPLERTVSSTTTCSGCGKERRDVQSVGRDYNGDPDAPDLCFLCRKKGGL